MIPFFSCSNRGSLRENMKLLQLFLLLVVHRCVSLGVYHDAVWLCQTACAHMIPFALITSAKWDIIFLVLLDCIHLSIWHPDLYIIQMNCLSSVLLEVIWFLKQIFVSFTTICVCNKQLALFEILNNNIIKLSRFNFDPRDKLLLY